MAVRLRVVEVARGMQMADSKGHAKPRLVKGQVGLARALAVGLRTVQLWQKEGAPGPIPSERGKPSGMYDADAWVRWMAERKPKLARERSESAADRIAREEAERRLVCAKMLREERKNEIEAGQCMSISQVNDTVNRLGRMFVGVLDRAAAELPALLAGIDTRSQREVITGWTNARRVELVAEIRKGKTAPVAESCGKSEAQ